MVIVTASDASLAPVAASVQYVRAAGADGTLDLRAALRELRARFDVRTALCEGGPSLNAQLFAPGRRSTSCSCRSPRCVAGGDDPAADRRRRATGSKPLTLSLAGALVADSHLFLRYRVGGADPLT